MGASAGENLTYIATLSVLDLDLDSISMVGIIMDQPFLGGIERIGEKL